MIDCTFNKNGMCRALKVTECPKFCRFAKTDKEYQQGLEDARKMLAAKGLKAVVKNIGGDFIMSTKRVK